MPSGQAPYNFVELPEKVWLVEYPPDQDRFHTDRHTGYIDLEIRAETPIYTRCAKPPEAEGLDSAFYHWGDANLPVIPGSSLRGAIRNLVEILSYSRLSRRREPRIESRPLVYRGVADQQSKVGGAYNELFVGPNGNYPSLNVKGGYLLKGSQNQWFIQPAAEYAGRSYTRVSVDAVRQLGLAKEQSWKKVFVGQPREVQSGSGRVILRYTKSDLIRLGADGPGMLEGTLVVPGSMPTQQKLPVIFHPNPALPKIEIPEEMWKQFDHDQHLHRGDKKKNRKITRDGDPLFYLVDNRGKLKFLGPNLFFRLPYDKNPLDLIPPESAEDENRLDFAECMFGLAGKTSKRDDGEQRLLFRGRVRFSDAPGQAGEFRLLEEMSPEILSGPKPTSYPYYVEQSPAAFGNRRELESYTSDKSRLRGFKRYWHRGRAELKPPVHSQEVPQDGTLNRDQYTTIRPVDKGSIFRGRVSFENLSDQELGGLLWALELPSSCRHHLGMGKPRGLGSVRLALTSVALFDAKKRFRHIEGDFQKSDSPEIAQAARAAFADAICQHTGHRGDLWSLPRLRELRCLLEWDNKPPDERTSYLGLGGFRGKQPLPRPTEVAGLSTASRRQPARENQPENRPQAGATHSIHPRPAAAPKAEKKRKLLEARVEEADDRTSRLVLFVGSRRSHVQLKKDDLKPKEFKDLRQKMIKVELVGERIVALILQGERKITLE